MAMRLEKLGNSFHCVELIRHTVYFSYETPIAFVDNETSEVVATQNDWGVTTGKHINLVDGGNKFGRVPHRDLVERMKELRIW